MNKFGLFALVWLAVASAYAQNPAPANEWYRTGHVTVRMTDAARDFTASWQFDRADNGDNRVVREEKRGANSSSGSVMTICDDNALLMKGFKPVRAHEMREIDEPVLHLQMVLRLLARAAPEGPAAFGGDKVIDIGDAKTAIRVRKGLNARREFNAPWQARGRLHHDAGGDIAYEIVFNFAGDNAQEPRRELTLAGEWRLDSNARSFEDATPIADWLVYRVNPVPVEIGGNTQMDMVSTTKPLRYATLGHLRRHIERAWSPNPKVKPILACKP